jgi:two-component system CheB/CheR fusion protein
MVVITPEQPGRLRVLVADDDPGSAASVAELVRILGHEPVVADGGTRAVEIASTTPIDVALLDIEMPEIDGLEVARRLLLLRRQGVYIAVITGRGSEADLQLSASAGVIEHLVKPCTMKALTGVLRRADDYLRRNAPAPQLH